MTTGMYDGETIVLQLWFFNTQKDDRYLKVVREIIDHCRDTLVIAFPSPPERDISSQ